LIEIKTFPAVNIIVPITANYAGAERKGKKEKEFG
jgi:hypothetical protein